MIGETDRPEVDTLSITEMWSVRWLSVNVVPTE